MVVSELPARKELEAYDVVLLGDVNPKPQRDPARKKSDPPVLKRYGPDGPDLPTTLEEWTEPKWISYVCHQDAPWLSPRIRSRVQGFAKVLACRFPTAQDWSTPAWGKATLRTLAGWRYATGRWDNPWELDLARKVIGLDLVPR